MYGSFNVFLVTFLVWYDIFIIICYNANIGLVTLYNSLI